MIELKHKGRQYGNTWKRNRLGILKFTECFLNHFLFQDCSYQPLVSKQQSILCWVNTSKRTYLFSHKIVLFVQHILTHSVACCTK